MHPPIYGIVHGNIIESPEGQFPLADGTKVLVTPVKPGTPAALLAAMAAEPHLTDEDIQALEESIAAGRRPRSRVEDFPSNPS